MDVGVCRLVSQLQWQTSLMHTPEEALIQAPSDKYSSRENPDTQWKREQGITRGERSRNCQKDQCFECVSLQLECQPLPLNIWPYVSETGGYVDTQRRGQAHTHTWKRPSTRPGRPDRHLTLEPIPLPNLQPSHCIADSNPLSSLTLPPSSSSFFCFTQVFIPVGWLTPQNTAVRWRQGRLHRVYTNLTLKPYFERPN